MIPFPPTPAMLVIPALVIAPGSPFTGIGFIQIAAFAALGSAIGKFASYGLGYGRVGHWPHPQRFDSLKNRLGGSTFLVSLVFAATPLVDAAFIPLGIMRYSAWKSFLSLYSDKFIWILSVLYAARTSQQNYHPRCGGRGADVYAVIFSASFVVSVAYLMVGVDWEGRVLSRQRTRFGRLARRLRDLLSGKQSRTTPSQG